MKHCRKVKGEQVVTLQMAQQLKNKSINVSYQFKATFLLETKIVIKT